MKRLVKVLISLLILSMVFWGIQFGGAKQVYAYNTDGILVDIDLNGGDKGNVKAGDPVTIKIKLNKVTDLYAASFNYNYDPNLLQVNSIDVDEKIESSGVYEPYKDTAKGGNRARFCFTFLGDGNGLSGDYNFVIINGQAKADGKINVGADNITFELIQRKGDDMVKNDYHFKDSEGNVYKVTNVENNNGSTETAGSNTAQGNTNSKKSNANVELVQRAGEGTDDSADDEDSSDSNGSESDIDKNDLGDKENEENSLSSSEETENAEDESSEVKNEEGKNTTSHIIAAIFGGIVIIALIGFYIIKIKNNK